MYPEADCEIRSNSGFYYGGELAGAIGSTVATAGIAGAGEGAAATEEAADAAGVATARGGVYSLRDEAGAVVRTGRTNDLVAREADHASDPVLGRFTFQTEYETDDYAEQRGLEQVLYDENPGAQVANGGFNKIRGISLSNPRLPEYMQAAQDFLGN